MELDTEEIFRFSFSPLLIRSHLAYSKARVVYNIHDVIPKVAVTSVVIRLSQTRASGFLVDSPPTEPENPGRICHFFNVFSTYSIYHVMLALEQTN